LPSFEIRTERALRIPLDDANVGDPVTLSARKTRFDIFAFEAGGGSSEPRFLNVLQYVDVDNRVETIRDFAGNQRHGATARADVKRGRPGTEDVLRYERGIANDDRQPGVRIGCPDAPMLEAERTAACPRRNLGRAFIPFEFEGDIAAVAFAVNKHASRLLTGWMCNAMIAELAQIEPRSEIKRAYSASERR